MYHILVAFIALFFAACSQAPNGSSVGSEEPVFTVYLDSQLGKKVNGGFVYKCGEDKIESSATVYGSNVIPSISWTGMPEGTIEVVLILYSNETNTKCLSNGDDKNCTHLFVSTLMDDGVVRNEVSDAYFPTYDGINPSYKGNKISTDNLILGRNSFGTGKGDYGNPDGLYTGPCGLNEEGVEFFVDVYALGGGGSGFTPGAYNISGNIAYTDVTLRKVLENNSVTVLATATTSAFFHAFDE